MTAGQGGSFLVNIKFISLCPVINVCVVFSVIKFWEGNQEQWNYSTLGFLGGVGEVSGYLWLAKGGGTYIWYLVFYLEFMAHRSIIPCVG